MISIYNSFSGILKRIRVEYSVVCGPKVLEIHFNHATLLQILRNLYKMLKHYDLLPIQNFNRSSYCSLTETYKRIQLH